jgi:hypothetical protein
MAKPIDIIQELSLKFSDFIKANMGNIKKLPTKQQQGISKAIRAFKVVLDDISENTEPIQVGTPVEVDDSGVGGVVMEINGSNITVRTKNGLVKTQRNKLTILD